MSELKACKHCRQSGWADGIMRPALGPYPMPKGGYCQFCNGRGWVGDNTRLKGNEEDGKT